MWTRGKIRHQQIARLLEHAARQLAGDIGIGRSRRRVNLECERHAVRHAECCPLADVQGERQSRGCAVHIVGEREVNPGLPCR
tara:strand:+ start:469 stop:717 length:249 start_codon:yes stop_codon:yes gene_type:complete